MAFFVEIFKENGVQVDCEMDTEDMGRNESFAALCTATRRVPVQRPTTQPVGKFTYELPFYVRDNNDMQINYEVSPMIEKLETKQWTILATTKSGLSN